MVVRVAVLDDYQAVARKFGDWDRLADEIELTVFTEYLGDLDEVARQLAGYQVICAMRERTAFPAELFDRLPELRLLVTTGASNPVIDLAAAARHGVTVCGTGAVPSGTAELTWALILALLRHVPAESAGMRTGEWQHTVGVDLDGATLGLVGLGRLGARVARIGQAFGMRVLAWSQNLTPERAATLGVQAVPKAELFAVSDVVSVHLKLSDRTVGLIGAAELRGMRRTGYLINTSRGPIVDETALVTALREGWIAGAGLDVYDVEPLPADHPLRSTPNTVLTPHLGYVTEATYRVFYPDTVADIEAFLRGTPVRVL